MSGPEGSPSPERAGGGKLVVVAALVEIAGADCQPKIFLARRAPGCRDSGLWELPGGKVEPGEEPSAALSREIREELGAGLKISGEAARYDGEIRGRAVTFLVFPSSFEGEPRPNGSHDLMDYFEAKEALGLSLAPLDGPALEAWASSRRGPGRERLPRCGA